MPAKAPDPKRGPHFFRNINSKSDRLLRQSHMAQDCPNRKEVNPLLRRSRF